MKHVFIFSAITILILLTACGDADDAENAKPMSAESMVKETENYDPHRGEGKWNEQNVIFNIPLNKEWSESGRMIAEVKCSACHKTSTEKLVGPGWHGVTKRRSPVWIMNFITNPDPMIDKDQEAQAMLELCLVRMPNQNLSDVEARNILEYMFSLEEVK
ncbi:MAG: c-type cytochrome [bacterium]|nr:c-type cytochrome [bacterium]